jgi:Plavaka transposase
VKVDGDHVGEGGETMSKDFELWMRDPVECMKELVGNPAFKESMSFVPERVYAEGNGTN